MGGIESVAPTLKRTLRSRHVALISIGGIIGAGLFVGSSANISTVGPAVLVSYALAGGLMFLVMRMLAEMAAANPNARSFADHATRRARLVGRDSRAAGCTGISGSSLSGSRRSPAPQSCRSWIALPVWQIGLVLMLLLTATNLLSTRSYGEFEFWFASIKVAAIVVFILIAGSYALGLTSPDRPHARQSRCARRFCAVRRLGRVRRRHGDRLFAHRRRDRDGCGGGVVRAVARDRDDDDVADLADLAVLCRARCSAFSPSCRGTKSRPARRRSLRRSIACRSRRRRRS